MHNLDIQRISQSLKEVVELEFYNKTRKNTNYKVLSIDGESIPKGHVILATFDVNRPVDSAAEKMKDIAYQWRDWFGRLELRDCLETKGITGKPKLKLLTYDKIIYSKQMWENGEQFSIRERLHLKGDQNL